MNYSNSEVIQCLRQYEMFANSLKLIRTTEEREMIIKQLTKLENKILSLTNEAYEEEYNALALRECSLLSEERKRVVDLIDLINQRLSYVEQRCNSHYQLTGVSIDAPLVAGASNLDELENKLRIIDKYTKNIKLKQEFEEDIKALTSKISLASEKNEINKSLNIELENVLKKTLSSAFDKLRLYDLLDAKNEVESNYEDLEKIVIIAKDNLASARSSNSDMIGECERMLNEVMVDYLEYKDALNTIRLLETYDSEVSTYEQLLDKRKEINEIVSNIKNQDLLGMIMDTITKQYNTILMEEQDINTYDDLVLERERKIVMLDNIEYENSSEEFQTVLRVLIQNERKQQEKIREEQRKIEAEEKKRKLEIERKRQEEVLKRQKIIEDTRKKEMEKRTKQMLEEQQNSVLQPKKKEEKPIEVKEEKEIPEDKKVEISFETIKDDLPKRENYREEKPEKELKFILNLKDDEEKQEPLAFKDKADIEKDLFDEFESSKTDDKVVTDEVFDKIDERLNDSKLPDMSIDEYMKNFDGNNIENTNSLFEEEDFPSIPL